MIPSALHSETHITQNEIQNEIKIETKKSANNSLTSVRSQVNSELLRQENEKHCEKDSEINKVVNGSLSVTNVQLGGKLFTSTNVYKITGDTNDRKKGLNSKRNKLALYPIKYWVQYGALEEADEPLDYTPDLNPFVAKALFITFVMFFCTATLVNIAWYSKRIRLLFLDEIVVKLLLVIGVIGLVSLFCTTICIPCIRVYPFNYMVLIIAVQCLSLVAGYVTAVSNIIFFAYSLAAVTVTVLACMFLALTSFDFSTFTIYFFVVGTAFAVLTMRLICASVFLGFNVCMPYMSILFSLTFINVVFLVIELQTILRSRTFLLDEDEYAFAAFLLYTSIYDIIFKLYQAYNLVFRKDRF